MMAAWSAGPTGAANMVSHAIIKRAIAGVSPDVRWGAAVRALGEAATAGTIPPVRAHAHNINKYYTMVRTLQKLEAGRLLASRTSSQPWFEDGLGAARNQLHDRIAYMAYVPQPGQVAERGRVDPTASVTQTRDTTDTANVSAAPTRSVVAGEALRQVTRTVTGGVPAGTVAAGGTANRGPADTAPTTTTTTTTPVTAGGDEELPANEKFANLFRLYAQYEYLRQRYMQKNGAVQLKFNPYVLAGFPGIAFDRATTSEHISGYVYTVNQAAMGKSMSTSVSLTCVRTLPEMLSDIRNDCERFSERLIAAPAEMIPEVRRVIQNEEQAEIFYQRLFYGGPRRGNAPAAFFFNRALGYTRGLDVEAITIEATEEVIQVPPEQSSVPEGERRDLLSLRARRANMTDTDPAARTLDGDINVLERRLLETHPNPSADVRRLQGELATARAERERLGYGEVGGLALFNNHDNVASARRFHDNRVEQLRTQLRDRVRNERTDVPDLAHDPNGPAAPSPEPTTQTRRTVSHSIDPNEALTPLPNTIYTDAFDNHHIAMQMCSRNVCSLTEYIRFWHGGRTLGDLLSSGDVEGPENEFSYGVTVERDVIAQGPISGGPREVTVGQATRYIAVFYQRIFRLRPGPGEPPGEAERGYTEAATPSATTAGVSGEYPQSRADWDSVLLAYRRKARSRLSPST